MRPLCAGAFTVLALLLGGCTVGPNYSRPPVTAPPVFRNAPQPDAPGAVPLGDEKWWTVFQDSELRKLVHTALTQNYDVRIAASRILQAQSRVGITRADQFPAVGATAGYASQFGVKGFQIQGLFSWTPDFWGRYRRATEAARANMLAAEWNRKEVMSTLVSSVAIAYFQLRELDLEMEIAQRTLVSRQGSLKLTETLETGGATSLLDVRQAQQLVETAAETIPALQREIAQQEDLLSTLIGENPHDIPRGLALTAEPLPQQVPTGLPSRLLERRPDIRAAEQQLIAANANIGVARSAYFPSLPLTASGGVGSPGLVGLFSGPAAIWTLSSSFAQPIFEGGALRANVRLTEAERQEALLAYQQTIQQAFRQVSDALIAYTKNREYTQHQQALTAAAQSAASLSDVRYRGGATSYLEVLTSQTNSFAAELELARARLDQRLALVQLYVALGGGWEQ